MTLKPYRLPFRIALFCIVALLAHQPSSAEDSASAVLSAQFEITIPPSSEISGSGVLYFNANGDWRTDYQWPVTQTVISKATETVILYPEDQLAILIDTPSMEPPGYLFFFAHSYTTYEHFANIGYRMIDFAVHQDTTFTTWVESSCENENKCNRIMVRRVGDLVVHMTTQNQDDTRKEFTVTETTRKGSATLPREVLIHQHSKGKQSLERVRYNEINPMELDEGVLFDTRIPDGYTVQHRRW
jgi:hypothetical protein